jgi:hypothetical protein
MVGPSPVTSNGTDATEIEDEASDEAQEGQASPPSVLGSIDSQSTVLVTRPKLRALLTCATVKKDQYESARSLTIITRRGIHFCHTCAGRL